jgi:hypothetical protein
VAEVHAYLLHKGRLFDKMIDNIPIPSPIIKINKNSLLPFPPPFISVQIPVHYAQFHGMSFEGTFQLFDYCRRPVVSAGTADPGALDCCQDRDMPKDHP